MAEEIVHCCAADFKTFYPLDRKVELLQMQDFLDFYQKGKSNVCFIAICLAVQRRSSIACTLGSCCHSLP